VSVKVLSVVWDSFPGGGSELLTLLAMADWSDDDGRCWPSIAALAKKVRLERRQAQRAVHRLIDAGFVNITGNETGGAPGSTRQYRIVLSRLTGVSHDTRRGVLGDTGVTEDTGVVEDADGCLPRRETGVSQDTQYVNEPSVHVKDMADKPPIDGKTVDSCPHQQIIDLYHEVIPMGRRVRVWSDSRKAKLRGRWREETKRQSLEWWRRFFGHIAKSDFLTGRTGTTTRSPFEIDLEWIVSPTNFIKILEGKYDNRS